MNRNYLRSHHTPPSPYCHHLASPEQGSEAWSSQICPPDQHCLCCLLSPREAGSGSAHPACSTWACPELPPICCWPCRCLTTSLLPWTMAALPMPSSWPVQEDLPGLSEPRAVTGHGPVRHQALSLRALSTVLPLKAGTLPSYQEPNHVAALNDHSGLLPRAGSRLGRWEGTNAWTMPSLLSGSGFIHLVIATIQERNSQLFLSSNFCNLAIPLSTRASHHPCPASHCSHGRTEDLQPWGTVDSGLPWTSGKETGITKLSGHELRL